MPVSKERVDNPVGAYMKQMVVAVINIFVLEHLIV